jgi:hypothetical protein
MAHQHSIVTPKQGPLLLIRLDDLSCLIDEALSPFELDDHLALHPNGFLEHVEHVAPIKNVSHSYKLSRGGLSTRALPTHDPRSSSYGDLADQ